MSYLALKLDNRSQDSLKELMTHYGVGSRSEIITKAISALKIISYIDRTKGELFARKNSLETRIILR